jgi:hypothetical protein
MRFLMLVRVDPENDPGYIDPTPWVEEMTGRGVLQFGQRLRSLTDGSTVRVRDGEVLVTDGPFAETRELVAGFDLLECASLAEAVEVAAQHPVASFGALEVRPLWE